jgi:parallel beta helix pectate lyase-like protein
MTRPIVRDVDVVTFSDDITKVPGTAEGPELLSNDDVPLVDPASGQSVDVYFVTATGGATGAGTQDDPMTIVQAESTAGASDVIFLLNDDGNLDVSGASGGTLTLKPYQQLLGIGDNTSRNVSLPNNHTLTVSTAAGRPTLTRPTGGNVVTMVWDNTVDGIAVSGGSSGIYGLNASNPTITDVAIQNTASNGIYLTNPSGTVAISDCVIQGNNADAIDVRSTAGGIVSLALSDNDIASNSGYGVYLQNTNAGILTVQLQNNAITGNAYQGMYISNANASTLTVDAVDSQIAGNGYQGMYLSNTNASTATVTLSDSQITGNGSQGLYVYNTGSSVATVDIVDNSITGNTSDGLRLFNYTGSTLTATVRDNLISDNSGDNIYCYNSQSTFDLVLNNNDILNSAANAGARLYNVAAGSVFSGDIEDNRITGNANLGLYLYNSGSSYSATLRDNTITGNQAGGIDYYSDAGATTLTIEDNTISNNSGGATAGDDIGLTIDQDTSAASTLALTLTNNLIENNGYTGIILDNADGAFTASLTGNSIANNGLYGAYITNRTTGVLTVDLYGNTLTENASVGVWLVNDTGTLNALFESNVMAMNTGDGLELDNINGGVFDYDLGGGGLGSAGLNSIFANGSGYDIDNDTATSITAQNAWWGASPPNPGRFSGAVDYTGYLVSDPN